MLRIFKFFDKLEDYVRASLSHYPVFYSLIGGTSLVLFWHGISVIAETVPFLNTLTGGLLLVFLSVSVLLMTGLFVSFFIGDTIILSGLSKEKKMIEKTEEENVEEAHMMQNMSKKISEIETIVKGLESKIK